MNVCESSPTLSNQLESAIFGTKPYILIYLSFSAPLLENMTSNECVSYTASKIWMFFWGRIFWKMACLICNVILKGKCSQFGKKFLMYRTKYLC